MKIEIISVLVQLGLLGSTCLAQPAATQPSTEDLSVVVNGSNTFAADLYGKVAAGKEGNVFFSPGSIHTALAMTYAGAAGTTAEQMAKTLHLTLPADKLNVAYGTLLGTLNNPPQADLVDETGKRLQQPAYQLTVANALWGQKGFTFKPAFMELLQKSYGAGLNEVDFKTQAEQARTAINDWVAQQTKDKIKDLIPKGVLNDLTRLVLTDAVYFKSNWAREFSKNATTDGPFMFTADKSSKVPLMHLTKSLGYLENDDLQVLELPYIRGALSMVVILPKKVDGLADVEKSLTAENIEKWLKDSKSTSVEVTLPRFKVSSDLMLADVLKGMGMKDAFDPDKADFSGMTSQEKLAISAVIHKAFVSVDEQGTEAAAATAVVAFAANGHGASPEQPKVFKADHPFIFLIRHNGSGEILFMGRLANPKAE